MATTKKAPAKKPAAKKTAAKKPAAKKPAAKKAPAKKTAAKKPAAKKPAAKKAPAKKTAAKKPAAKKAPAKKPAAAKPAVKAAVKKTTAPPPKKHVDSLDSKVKFRNLFDAFKQGKLPLVQGYIISSFFSESSAYSIYEVVSYAGVKEIYQTADGLTFVSGGKKLHVLVEPDTYHQKHVEPVSRSKTEGEYIPQRYSELEIIVAKNQSKIMVAKEAVEITSSFTILEPRGINFSVVFYDLPDVNNTIASYFQESLNRQRKIPELDAKKAARLIIETIQRSMSFAGQFQ